MTATLADIKSVIVKRGIRHVLSPQVLSGTLVACGLPQASAYRKAQNIVKEIKTQSLPEKEYFKHVVESLTNSVQTHFITFELVRRFLISKKSKSPLFIFMGGLAGKTTLSTYIAHQLDVSRIIAIDELKNVARKEHTQKKFLFPATYESTDSYKKTVDFLIPYMEDKLKSNLKEYSVYKKWCYFWEGIYLSPETLSHICKDFPHVYSLNTFLLPPFSEIKRRYKVRWVSELGEEEMKKSKKNIEKYLANLEKIYNIFNDQKKDIQSEKVSAILLEDQLTIFYEALSKKLKEIADNEIPGWVEKIKKDPSLFEDYSDFLKT